MDQLRSEIDMPSKSEQPVEEIVPHGRSRFTPCHAITDRPRVGPSFDE